MITSLGEEKAGLCASREFVCLFCMRQFLSLFSSSWCQGLAAAYLMVPYLLLLVLAVRIHTLVHLFCE